MIHDFVWEQIPRTSILTGFCRHCLVGAYTASLMGILCPGPLSGSSPQSALQSAGFGN